MSEKTLRERFTENAEQFDQLMVEMLKENEDLKKENKKLKLLEQTTNKPCEPDCGCFYCRVII